MDPHAQQEIRDYATTIGEQIVAKWVPVTWEAFLDYRRQAMRLSRTEIEVIAAVSSGETDRAVHLATEHGFLSRNDNGRLRPNRERSELEHKLTKLGLPAPWNG
jgi:thymidylate synthase (FAD)